MTAARSDDGATQCDVEWDVEPQAARGAATVLTPERRERVLVAEDNRVLADVVRYNLEKAGFDVVVASDGQRAIEALNDGPVELLITDLQMPHVDGIGVCRHVRETLKLLDLPIVMCSAKGLELDTEQLQSQWKLAKVFFKPFSVREVVELARSLVAAARRGAERP
jgi:DNA-binding response OmpR family regulator